MWSQPSLPVSLDDTDNYCPKINPHSKQSKLLKTILSFHRVNLFMHKISDSYIVPKGTNREYTIHLTYHDCSML